MSTEGDETNLPVGDKEVEGHKRQVSTEHDIEKLKQQKTKTKTIFTKIRNQLMSILDFDEDEEPPSKKLVRECNTKLCQAMDDVMQTFTDLSDEYETREDFENVKKLTPQMDEIEERFSEATGKLEHYYQKIKNDSSSLASVSFKSLNLKSEKSSMKSQRIDQPPVSQISGHIDRTPAIEAFLNSEPSKSVAIGQDLWKQLQRVSIPVFAGDKKVYESWKAAFMACIDSAPATPEYKLLQLRQYLSGKALQVVKGLGHSATAYEAAKDRLERKFGGQRRQIAIQLEELESLKPIRNGNHYDLENFADSLELAVINLKEANRYDELGNGTLYQKLQRKLPEDMVARYHRWVVEHRRPEAVDTLRQWVIEESEYQTIAAEAVRGISSKSDRNYATNYQPDNNYQKSPACIVCTGSHPVYMCEQFKKFDINQRWTVAKEHKLCFRCLGRRHLRFKCFRGRVCGINGCQYTHNKLLHQNSQDSYRNTKLKVDTPEFQPSGYPTYSPTEGEQKSTHTMVANGRLQNIGLRTIPVMLRNGDRQIKANGMLDDGSTKTYINSAVAAQLGLQGELRKVQVNLLNGKAETFETMPVDFELTSLNGRFTKKMTAFTTDRVTGDMQAVDWKIYMHKWKHLQGIKFLDVEPHSTIDILIGLDYPDLHYSFKDIQGKPGEPIARLTPLGWTCTGDPEPELYDTARTNFMATYFTRQQKPEDDELNVLVQKFWDIENVKEASPQLSKSDQIAMSQVEKTLQFKDGKYEIGIPWKYQDIEMPNNYQLAFQRLVNTENRLRKNKMVAEAYSDIIQKYLEKGYIEKVPIYDAYSEKKWFLPHFAVLKPDKATTKTRLVFDASMKCDGASLNDMIHQGPKLQRELPEVLLRFRRQPVALVCDIAEMYLRIGILPDDRKYHRFLWRWMNTDESPTQFQFTRVVFGVNASPFLAQYVTQKHAELNAEKFPMAAETVLKSTYMDDSMDSVSDDASGIELFKQLSELWGAAGMHARKWLSNSEVVLQHIPVEDRSQEVDLDQGYLPTVKTLGVMWVPKEDNFTFKGTSPPEDFKLTKRTYLQKIASLFDPTGFLSPYVVRAKILLQETWTAGIDWDEHLPDELSIKARKWFKELNDISLVKVPRCLRLGPEHVVNSLSVHMFSDSSEEAYGAVVYVRYVYKDGTKSTNIVASKSRVAPLNVVSIPRLELMAAVLGLRLILPISQVLDVSVNRITFWTDSMNVLWWIRGQGRLYKPFVANRVGEIHSQSNPDQWRHVPTKMNPADILSRGETINNLCQSELWWKGPVFLRDDESTWPETLIKVKNDVFAEVKKSKRDGLLSLYCHNTFTTVAEKLDLNWRLNPIRYSCWNRLKRVQAWVNRFINNCRLAQEERVRGILLPEELDDVESQILRKAQQEAFPSEYNALVKSRSLPNTSKILVMKPRLDDEGLIRSDGRLKNAEYLSFNVRYPILLPRKNWVTKLIVKHFHEEGKHVAGTNHTLALLSSKYWIMSCREEIREWETECAGCRRRKAKTATQVMAPLPTNRLSLPLKAFAQTGVDFGGPFLTIQGRGKTRQKRYLALFTCLKTRAVHLEVAFGLDTDSFLNAFYRFANRRGMPIEMLSDNGTNFVGANKELKALIKLLDKDQIQNSTANQGLKWVFNPPLSPHFGGIFETMIKAAKKAINAILSSADVTDEELMTAFTGAESLINSRPLTYQSANPLDDTPLTPNHFLHGQLGGKFAPESTDTTDFSSRKRWRRVQELVKHFWYRWIQEWLPGLNARKKWLQTNRDFKVDDVVLVMSSDTSRGNWPMGRIVEIFPGKDNHVRVCKVRIGKNIFTRSISKLCPLEQVCDE